MGQLQAKSPYLLANNNQVPDQKHATCLMANGKLATLILDPGVDGGQTNPRCHVYVANADRSAMATPLFWSYSDVDPDTKAFMGMASMAIDASGNLHVAYVWHQGTSDAQSVRYRKLTYASDTFTVGAEVIVSAAVTNRIVTSLDIDAVSNDTLYPVIVAAYRSGTSAPYSSTVVAYNKTSSSWNAQTIQTISGNFTTNEVSVACRQDAAVGGLFQMVITYNPGPPNVSTDPGDSVYIARANVGGAWVAGSVVKIYNALNKNLNAGYRSWNVFWLSNDCFFLQCVAQSAPSKTWVAIVSTSPSANTWAAEVAPRVIEVPTGRWYRYGRRFASANLVRNPVTPSTKGSLVLFQVTNDNVYAMSYDWERIGLSWTIADPKSFPVWSRGFTVPSTFLVPWAGERGRFSDTRYVDVLTPHYQMNSKTIVKKVYLWKRPALANKTISLPAEGATVATNTPDISVDVTGVGADSAAVSQRVRVQVSTSTSFASNVFTVEQSVADQNYYTSSKSTVKVSLANYPLVQATWFARVQMVDQFGGVSPWSEVRKFTVSHPPSAINLSPRDGAVLVYTPQGSRFNWKFTDAFAQDVQTAWRIDVTDAATESIVVSTGKTAGSNQLADVVLPVGSLEHDLNWTLTVWDGDDVSSAPISGGTVLLTQAPSPVIQYPAIDGDDLPTAVPTFTWDSGVTGSKVQTVFRVQLRGSDGTLLYDNRGVQSAATSLTLQPGILRNNRRYTLSLTVTDSTKLDTTVTRIFDTAWPIPVSMPRPDVYLDDYDSRGFATVQVSTVGRDEDFLAFNLYRRSVEGDRIWTLIHTVATASDYVVFKDYFMPSGVMCEYVMTQVADRFGDQIESAISVTPRAQVKAMNSYYWLIDATDLEKSLRVSGVSSDNYTPEIEEASYTVVNRGRQFEIGEDVGITGTLSAKVRDKDSGGFFRENYNLLGNPNLEDGPLGTPDGWQVEISQGSGTILADTLELPAGPGNRRTGRLRLTGAKTADIAANFVGSISRVISKSPYFSMTANMPHFAAVWMSLPAAVAGYTVQLTLEWREGLLVRSSETISFPTSSIVVPSNKRIDVKSVNGVTWYRVGKATKVPTGYPNLDNLKFKVALVSDAATATTAPPVAVDIEAGIFCLGSDPIAYFSGAEDAGEWTGVVNVDASFTQGFFSARKQRQWLMTIQEEQHSLFLRNPFGDVWAVHVGNLTIEREAGLASSEGVTIEIPYFELRS